MPTSVPGTCVSTRAARARLRRRSRHVGPARRCACGVRGFTLLELVVVMLLLAVLLGMTGVHLTRDRADIVRDQAGRLVIALQGAQQQAILEGRPYVFALTPGGYRFFRVDAKGKSVPVAAANPLAPHALPYPLKLESGAARAVADKRPDIVFEPSGAFSPFMLILRFDDVVWYIEGRSDGEIRASATPPPAAA